MKVLIENFGPFACSLPGDNALNILRESLRALSQKYAFPLIFVSKHEVQGILASPSSLLHYGCTACSSCGPNSRGCAGQWGCGAGPGWRRGCCQLGTEDTAMSSFPVGPRRRAESVSITGSIAGSIAAATPRARVLSARHPRRTGWECLSCVCIKSSFLDAATAVLGAFRGLVSGIAPSAVRERRAGSAELAGSPVRPGPSRPLVGRCE